MVFSGKHNRNARRGQSLFTAARRPWPFFIVRRRATGAFFVRTPAREPEGCPRAWRHVAAWAPGQPGGRRRPPRSGARAGCPGRGLPQVVLPAGCIRPYPGRPACVKIEPGVVCGRRPGEPQTLPPPRAARDAPVRLACPGENEVGDGNHGDGNHDDSRVITRA
jgi:hypothetical protein